MPRNNQASAKSVRVSKFAAALFSLKPIHLPNIAINTINTGESDATGLVLTVPAVFATCFCR